MSEHDLILAILFALIALLYSSVGHAGASGYLAVMALAEVAPAQMKPVALVMNTAVAAIGTYNFWRGGWFRWRLFWPFALTSIPLALLGGAITLPDLYYKPLVGAVLIYSAARLLFPPRGRETALHPPAVPVAVGAGAGLGFLSGLTGVGGGIFLSPLVVLAGWGNVREASGVAAPFILVNSIAGLIGRGLVTSGIPGPTWPWLAAVLAGGVLGSWLGSRRLPMPSIRRLLAIVLFLAGAKMLLALG
ncbi:MAG: sulfite exporter TauE/SafE family protein [Rudaea sp.]